MVGVAINTYLVLLVTLLSITHHIQANSSKLLPLVNLCCNQSIVGRPAGVSMVCSVAMLPHALLALRHDSWLGHLGAVP